MLPLNRRVERTARKRDMWRASESTESTVTTGTKGQSEAETGDSVSLAKLNSYFLIYNAARQSTGDPDVICTRGELY